MLHGIPADMNKGLSHEFMLYQLAPYGPEHDRNDRRLAQHAQLGGPDPHACAPS